jgi:hypothetical protein
MNTITSIARALAIVLLAVATFAAGFQVGFWHSRVDLKHNLEVRTQVYTVPSAALGNSPPGVYFAGRAEAYRELNDSLR